MTTRRGRGRAIVAVAAVAGLATVAGCSGTESISGPGRTGPVELGDIRLISHGTCDDLLDWFHTEAASRVGPYGLDGLTAYPTTMRGAAEDSASSMAGASTSAPASAADEGAAVDDTSTTNTQEPGVGEPDLTWTDGTRLVTIVNQRLQVVDLAAATVTADVDLSTEGTYASPTGLLVDGDHALVLQSADRMYAYDGVARGGTSSPGVASDSSTVMPTSTEPTTVLTRVDLGATPAVVGSVSVQGSLVDARMVDGVVRTVVRSSPADLGFVYPSGNSRAAVARATQVNQEMVTGSTIDDWLPSMTVTVGGRETATSPAVDCAAVDHPAEFGGFGVVTVVGLDLGAGAVDPLPSAAVVGDAQTVYSSGDALYVATPRHPGAYPTYSPDGTTTDTVPAQDMVPSTDVHAFSLPTDAAARYEASGSVPGTLIGQFALSEHDGDLRVASTVPAGWSSGPMPMAIEDGVTSGATAVAPTTSPTTSESRITVLRPDGDTLAAIGEVTGLGPTEQIRGVRFAGPTAYVVTFRQTDPLYVVDLSDPTAPTVAGELKIPGYSSYLQVLDEGRVLGIGQDATDRGRATGLQESLFDVSDASNPTRTAQLVVPGAYSTAESDHHALLWWPGSDLLAVPVQSFGADDGQPFEGVLVTRVADGEITSVGTITHPSDGTAYAVPSCPAGVPCVPQPIAYPTPIARTLVADGKLVTVSTAGVKVSDLTTLADISWTSLR
jgi:uncharacterized secreted protein with C-terminal beta-propeller domain